MSEQSNCNHVTLAELVVFLLLIWIGVSILTFIGWSDTRDLQRRVGTLEQRVRQ